MQGQSAERAPALLRMIHNLRAALQPVQPPPCIPLAPAALPLHTASPVGHARYQQ